MSVCVPPPHTHHQNVDLEAHIHSTFGYNLDAFNRDVWIVFGIGFLLRVLAAVVMWASDRKRKV